MSLSIEEILAAADNQIRKVPCPEWGGDVCICTLWAEDRDRWEDDNVHDKTTRRARLIARSLCDESGKRLNPSEAEIKALARKAMAPMERLLDAITDLNRMGIKGIEEQEKNLGATDGNGSG